MILNDYRLQEGSPEKPVVALIHGFGMNGRFWEQPESCPVLGGLASLTSFLADQPPADRTRAIAAGRMNAKLKGMAARLGGDGYSVASWSQSAPLGPVATATAELVEVLSRVREKLPGRPIWLIAHSRGGLVARYFLQEYQPTGIVGCITLGTPHHGTELASLSRYLQPVGVFLRKVFRAAGREGKVDSPLQRVASFLRSEAIVELQPGSQLLKSLTVPVPCQMPFFSSGGTNPGLFSFYLRLNDGFRPFVFPDFLLRFIPDRKIPRELQAGEGDGLVSAASSTMAGERHRNFGVNHVQLAFDPEVYRWVTDILSQEGR